jgi:hypothetical protein
MGRSSCTAIKWSSRQLQLTQRQPPSLLSHIPQSPVVQAVVTLAACHDVQAVGVCSRSSTLHVTVCCGKLRATQAGHGDGTDKHAGLMQVRCSLDLVAQAQL